MLLAGSDLCCPNRSAKHRFTISTTSSSKKSIRWICPVGISVSWMIQPFAASMRSPSLASNGLCVSVTSLQNNRSPDEKAPFALSHSMSSSSSSGLSSCHSVSATSALPEETIRHTTPRQSPKFASVTTSSTTSAANAVEPQSQSLPSLVQRLQNSLSNLSNALLNTSNVLSSIELRIAEFRFARALCSSISISGNFSAENLAA
mmetsp:Transcript_15408/g.23905  ORF Transcript_15408/g.23905 Transcript_15408/m.23905 type:complete len:204 (+) Transcript_15408:159-770(+)